jgi:hypothetical protein
MVPEKGKLALEARGQGHVVRVDPRQPRRSRGGDGAVESATVPQIRLVKNQANARIFRGGFLQEIARAVGAHVIDDHKFEIGKALGQNTLHGLPDIRQTIPHRENDGNRWVHPHGPHNTEPGGEGKLFRGDFVIQALYSLGPGFDRLHLAAAQARG